MARLGGELPHLYLLVRDLGCQEDQCHVKDIFCKDRTEEHYM